MDLKALRAVRGGHRANVTRTLKKVADLLQQAGTVQADTPRRPPLASTLKLYRDTIEEKLTCLRQLNDDVLAQLQDPAEIETEIETSDEFEEKARESLVTLSYFLDVQSSSPQRQPAPTTTPLQTAAPVQPPPENPPDTQVQTPLPTSRSSFQGQIRLPKLTLPTFHGDPLQWQTFWDAFSTAIHSNTDLADVQKFNYLRAHLASHATSCVAGLPTTSDNYQRAVDLLQDRFGKPHQVVRAHMQALMELSPCQPTATSLRKFYDTVECHIRGLAALGKTVDTFGDFLVPILLERLPGNTIETLTRAHGSADWSIDALRAALLQEITVLELKPTPTMGNLPAPAASTAMFHSSAANSRQRSSHAGTGRSPPHQKMCAYCKQPHSSNYCTTVSTRDDRLGIVHRNRLCFNCLSTQHAVAHCTARGRCRHCNGKHHSSLCKKGFIAPTPALSVTEPAQPAASAPVPSHVTSLQTASQDIGSHILSKTAVAYVQSSHSTCRANILFDEGAQRSFISQELADSLRLPTLSYETVQLSTFGIKSTTPGQCPLFHF